MGAGAGTPRCGRQGFSTDTFPSLRASSLLLSNCPIDRRVLAYRTDIDDTLMRRTCDVNAYINAIVHIDVDTDSHQFSDIPPKE
jgi:hypothetical protein